MLMRGKKTKKRANTISVEKICTKERFVYILRNHCAGKSLYVNIYEDSTSCSLHAHIRENLISSFIQSDSAEQFVIERIG